MAERSSPARLALHIAILSFLGISAASRHQSEAVLAGQESEQRQPGSRKWWPTQIGTIQADYVGASACSQCHPAEVASQKATHMAHAAVAPANSEVLRTYPLLTFRSGPYSYQIKREGQRSTYTVSDGRRSISAPILWAQGVGVVGQTYLFQRGGSTYETRVSFYPDTKSLGLTLGYPIAAPSTIEEALGNRLPPEVARLCVSCHATGAVTSSHLGPSGLAPGVTCEACHGPGARHVAAIKAGKVQETFILNPARLTPSDSVDFCGACHRTWWHVVLQRIRGVENVRFQPYRLQNSRCWTMTKGIPCITCHDPHQRLQHDPALYDSKCLGCHLPQGQAQPTQDHHGKPCPVSASNCVTCHMPKYKVAGAQFRFTDHWIRLARPGTPYPD